MKNFFFTVLLTILPYMVVGQVQKLQPKAGRVNTGNNTGVDFSEGQAIEDKEKPPITDYKIISIKGDTTHVDTTLTIKRDYKFNYLRKDNFELLAFSNVGRPYTRLGYSFEEVDLMPKFGARARHFNFMEVEDIYYYHVPTPVTELLYKSVFEQGQVLDAFFTANITPQLNFSIAYKGLRSLGKYQHVLSSTGNLRIGVSYHSKNKRYAIKTHFVAQDLMNQENGGLTPLAVKQFKNKLGEFDDRSLLSVNFTDAENVLLGKRFYMNHYFNLSPATDSLRTSELRVGHILNFSDKEYHYKQEAASPLFGQAYETVGLDDELEFQEVTNLVYVNYFNDFLGDLKVKASHANYNYGYHSLLLLDETTVPNRIKGNVIAAGASYAKNIGGFSLHADAMMNVSGDFNGNYFTADAAYQLTESSRAKASVKINSHAPNYNFLLYQSDYKNYNWYNDFENVQQQSLQLDFESEKWFNLKINYTELKNHTYFGLVKNEAQNPTADSLVRPFQYTGTVKYLKLKANKEFSYGRFALNNTLMYQNVLDGKDVFHVPSFVTRNSLYYKDYWFEKALYLQTGFTLNYFTSYEANGYDPVLAEFYVQDLQELKGFATVDFFFNAKVSQARIYFKLENVADIFMGNKNFVAPGYAYRDFSVRFGIVWNFFL